MRESRLAGCRVKLQVHASPSYRVPAGGLVGSVLKGKSCCVLWEGRVKDVLAGCCAGVVPSASPSF